MAMELKTVQGVIAVAAPSDTHHLASLLETMNPKIVAKGDGAVSIGGRLYDIRKQMLDDFRAYDLVSTVRAMTKPLLAFHSPSDETVGFQNALVNCGFDSMSPVHNSSTRSLISLPNCNHLLTTSDEDCVLVAAATSSWCKRIIAG